MKYDHGVVIALLGGSGITVNVVGTKRVVFFRLPAELQDKHDAKRPYLQ